MVKGKNPRKQWTVRYWVGGRQREKSFATSREARDFKIKTEHDARASIFIDPDMTTTLGEYAGTWLAQHTVSDGTRRVYTSIFENRVKPVLGDKPLGKITRDDVRTLLLETMPREVGPAAVKTARTLLVAMLGEAVAAGKLAANPAARIKLPSQQNERAEFTMATHQQLSALTAELPEGWQLAVWLMRGCGLRIGEALAVRADCVRGDELRAEEQVLWLGQRGPLKSRKPGQYRDVPLPQYAAEEIEAHMERFMVPATGYLFPTFATGDDRPDAFRAAFRRAAKSAGLPQNFTPHDLRHTYASVALHAGVPLTEVSRWLGHKDVNLTHQIYGHMVPRAVGRARSVLDDEYQAWSAEQSGR